MVETLSTLFRLPPNGMPMTIMQLAGFPAEVVDSVVSVLLRMAFEFGLWSDGAFPLLGRLRGSAPLRAGRPHDRLRPDPQGGVAHRQGRPQVRRVPRADHAAPGRARRHHHLAMLDAVRDAHGERPRPGDRALGGVGRGGLADRLRALARHARGVRVRRRRGAADAAALQAARRSSTSRTREAVTRAHMDSAAASTSASSSRWWSAGAAPRMGSQTRARPRSAAATTGRSRRSRYARRQRVLARCAPDGAACSGAASRRRARSRSSHPRTTATSAGSRSSSRVGTSPKLVAVLADAAIATQPPSAASPRA